MRPRHEAVQIGRTVQVERVPDGGTVELAAGTPAFVTQALGSAFTLYVDGQLMRLRGADADAIGKAVPSTPGAAADQAEMPIDEHVWRVLRNCYDPEIPVNIVDLGLVYGCELSPLADGRQKVEVRMTLTAPGCGMGELIAEDVCDRLLELPQVGEATVSMVFDPPWDRSRISEAAQLELGL